ncbi:MAG: phosphatidate cytidylyltransferase [Chloroflexota bacterium]|nr:phosphatidate cytidylyltransferase [Chloroflexota bacterium]
MFRTRVISAAVLVPVVAIAFLAGNPWLTIGVAALTLVAAIEGASLIRRAGLPADPGIPILLAPLAVLGTLTDWTLAGALAFDVAVIVLAAVAAFRHREARAAFLGWVGGSFGAIYVSLLAFVPLAMLAAPAVPRTSPLHGVLDAGRIWVLILVLTVWACDTFAYLVGRRYPRGRMLPHLSPNKTWSGGIGGTVAAMIACGVLATVLAGAHPIVAALLGGFIAIAAQAGDASESLLKRAAGAKDSGRAIPGHGGILDRVDSFLFAAPALYVVLVMAPDLLVAGAG